MSLYQPLSLIDGQWVGASSGATFDVINPATGQVLEEVADLSAEDCSERRLMLPTQPSLNGQP